MKDIKPIISKNLVYFRKENGLTQAELAEKLNYSDKAVSRWENGDTLPDINVLYQLCEFYGIDMNTLVSDEAETLELPEENKKHNVTYRVCLFGLAISTVFLIATIMFFYSKAINDNYFWMAFIWALPVSCVAILFVSRSWKNRVFRFVVNTVLSWTLIVAVFLHFIVQNHNFWPIFLVGIPVQIMEIMWFKIKKSN